METGRLSGRNATECTSMLIYAFCVPKTRVFGGKQPTEWLQRPFHAFYGTKMSLEQTERKLHTAQDEKTGLLFHFVRAKTLFFAEKAARKAKTTAFLHFARRKCAAGRG